MARQLPLLILFLGAQAKWGIQFFGGLRRFLYSVQGPQDRHLTFLFPLFFPCDDIPYFYMFFPSFPNGAIPPVRLGLSGTNSGKIPERPRKRSESFSWNSPWEYGWDPPSPVIQGIWGFQSISRILSPPARLFRNGSGEGLSEPVMEFPAVLGYFREEKTYTTTTERKSFGELFRPQRKTFQAGGGYKNPIKTQENHIHHRNLSSVDPIFFVQRKVLHWSRAVYAFFFSQYFQDFESSGGTDPCPHGAPLSLHTPKTDNLLWFALLETRQGHLLRTAQSVSFAPKVIRRQLSVT